MKLSVVQRPRQDLTAPHGISPACRACAWARTWGQEWSSLFPSGGIWLLQPPTGMESQALPQVPAFQGFPHQPDATPSQKRKRKRKACMMPAYLKSEAMPPSPSTHRGSSQAGSAHPQCLALSTCAQRKHWDFLPGPGNFIINSSAKDATVAFIRQTHQES